MNKKYSEVKPGEVFQYGGYSWIKLEDEGLALMKNILEQRAFDEGENNWMKSELREYLNNNFYEKLTENGADKTDFLFIEANLTADDGMKEYGISKDLISLMTADSYKQNRHLLKPLERWWWLATPYSCLTSKACSVCCIYSFTRCYYNAYYASIGVRPLVKLKSDTFVEVEGENLENTESLFEKNQKMVN